jgi:hypothetical protein
MCYSDVVLIFVFLGTLGLMLAIFGWGVHVSKPRVVATDMRRADYAESIEPDMTLCEPPRRAFDASTWAQV